MMSTDPIEFLGAPGSPYTRKMLALLRYRRIPYRVLWGSHRGTWGSDIDGNTYPEPKVKLLPTFYFPAEDGGLEAVVDSTPIIRRLERSHAGRSALPDDPALGFLNDLIEDFADEWLTKAMFHYRWAYDADIKNAGPLLTFWQNTQWPREEARQIAAMVSTRQIERLYVVGSNDVTAPVIEDSYKRLLDILDSLLQAQTYVLGGRPASADFALYGQLTQLGIVDPTPAKVLNERAPRLRAWIDRVDDLSGHAEGTGDWAALSDLAPRLTPLLTEIGRVYVPFLLANAAAVQDGAKEFETTIDGKRWAQPTFPYQAKCLMWLREGFDALPDTAKVQLHSLLAATGCAPLLTP